MRFEGQVAIITGGGRGLGLTLARRMVAEGARVALAGRTAAMLEDRAKELGSGALAWPCDISDAEQASAMVRGVSERLGRLDILINNAAVLGPMVDAADYPVDAWREVLAVNLDGPFYCSRAAVPYLLKTGGRIVNVSSIAGKEGNPRMSAYSSAKAGLIALTKSMGKELARAGVAVNCVVPGLFESPFADQVSAAELELLKSKIPMGRAGTMDEVAAMVLFVASRECSFNTGAIFDCSGGRATY